jgi:long-chain acyl-CoA synthetase
MSLTTLNTTLARSVQLYSEKPALKFRHEDQVITITYQELGRQIQALGTGLLALELRAGERVGLIAENRPEWLIADLALLGCGAVDVPRGGEISLAELRYILEHSDAVGVFVEDEKQLTKLESIRAGLVGLRFIIVMDPTFTGSGRPHTYSMTEIRERGIQRLVQGDYSFLERSQRVKAEDLATIIYTSGTTGTPRGVMLSHANIMHNVRTCPSLLQITSNDRFLSMLPTWHSFERTVEYVVLSAGASIFYSKPVKQILLPDLQYEQPTFMAGVPRIWQGLYKGVLLNVTKEPAFKQWLFHIGLRVGRLYKKVERIRQDLDPLFSLPSLMKQGVRKAAATVLYWATKPLYALFDKILYAKIRHITGGKLRAAISGGSALPRRVDDFFAAVGLTMLEGYGLTETAPVVAVRLFGREIPYTVGTLLPETFVRIVDDNGQAMPLGEQGIIWIRGPQVMRGYYKDKDTTEKTINSEGWLNSGDLGRLTIQGALQITGRIKDTIVLLTGENVEPVPLETQLLESPYIHQAMVVGQDQRTLGALIVPDFTALENYGKTVGVSTSSAQELLTLPVVQELYRKEIQRLISPQKGFRACERIGGFVLLPYEFRVGEELTHTLKMKRNVITQQFAKEIAQIYHVG